MKRGWQVAAALGLLTGCPESVEKPTPPDMSSLVAAFETPDGEFTEETAPEMLTFLEQKLDEVALILTDDQLQQLFAAAGGSVEAPRSDTQDTVNTDQGTIEVEGGAVLEVTRICDGWASPPQITDDNGSLDMTVTVEDIRVDPVMWVDLARCRYASGGVRILADQGSRRDVGDIRIHVGEDLALEELETSPKIIDLDMSASQDDASAELVSAQFKFFTEDKRVDVLVTTSTGFVVVHTSERVVLGVRASNGDFTCHPTTRICTSDDGLAVDLDPDD